MAKIIVAALLVLAALAYLWFLDRGRGPQSPSGAEAEAAAADPPAAAAPAQGSRVETPDDARAATAGATADATAAAPAVSAGSELQFLEGVVVDDLEHPLAGAWVVSLVEGEPVYTDADGRFRLRIQQRGSGDSGRSVVAWAEGKEVSEQWLRFEDEGYFRLRPQGRSLAQVVRQGDEAPIPGARLRAVVGAEARAEDAPLARPHWIEVPAEIADTDGTGATRVPLGQCEYFVTAAGYDPLIGGFQDNPDPRFAGRLHLRLAADRSLRFVLADGTAFAGAQVGFGAGDPHGTTDADGWVEIPPIARSRGYWEVRVLRGPVRWVAFPPEMDEEAIDGPYPSGTVLTVGHFARTGILDANGRGAPEQYEVASGALHTAWGDYITPATSALPSLLAWAPVAADGAFSLVEGWQGEQTALLVRERAGARLVWQEELLGPGPYQVRLPPAGMARLHIVAQPAESVEGAQLQLSRDDAPDWSDWEETPRVHGGAIELALEPGRYDVSLVLADRRTSFDLESFTMPDRDYEHWFDLGQLRTVRGRVEAGGKPVYPCAVTLYDGKGFSARVAADSGGQFMVAHVPQRDLKLRLRPGDPWLQEVHRPERVVPAVAVEQVVRIPVGTLQFLPGGLDGIEPSRVRVHRSTLPEHGHRRATWDNVRLPALDAEPVTLRVTPSVIRFASGQPYAALIPEEIRIDEGELETVSFASRPLGVVEVKLRGQDGRYQAQVEVSDAEGRSLSNELLQVRMRFENTGGAALWRCALNPGPWRIRVRGPIAIPWDDESQPLAGPEARFEGTVEAVANRTSILWLSVEQDGALRGEVEIGR